MNRQVFRWMVAGACCLLVGAPAWGQRDRDRDEDRPLARSGEGRREEPKRPPGPPKVMILRLKHVSAQSFVEVLKQLARVDAVREMLEKVPVAMNPESNTVVILAPPEACEVFERIADGVDQPSEFHERMRELKMDEMRRGMELKQEMQKRGMPMGKPMPGAGPMPGVPGPFPMMVPGQQPMPGAGPGGPGMPQARQLGPSPWGGGRARGPEGRDVLKPARPRPEGQPERPTPPRKEGPERPGAVVERGLPDPAAAVLKRLLDRGVIEKLGLEPEQVEKIEQIAKEHFPQMEQLRQRVRQAIERADPGERAGAAEKILQGAGQRIQEMAREVHERLGGVLQPQQREKLGEMLRLQGGQPPREPGETPRERQGRPEGRAREGEPRRGEKER